MLPGCSSCSCPCGYRWLAATLLFSLYPFSNVCRTFAVSDNVAPILTHSSGGDAETSVLLRHYDSFLPACPVVIILPSSRCSSLLHASPTTSRSQCVMVPSFCFGPFIICQCQSWSQSVSFAFHYHFASYGAAAAASWSLFAFCQNGNEENLHGRCICGIFPCGRGRSRRLDGHGRLGVRMSFLIISVFAFFAFALFLVHLCTLSPSPPPSPCLCLCLCPPTVICLAFLCVFQKVLCKSCASPALICCVQPFEMRQLFAQLPNTVVVVTVVVLVAHVVVVVVVVVLATAATCSSFIMLTL